MTSKPHSVPIITGGSERYVLLRDYRALVEQLETLREAAQALIYDFDIGNDIDFDRLKGALSDSNPASRPS